jgi:ABC-type nitrate/sulfonate/bicarbonate transport system substrate-binding protein
MVGRRNRLLRLGAAALPFVAPIAPLWLVLEQLAFYKADGGQLQNSGWWGLGGTLAISLLIGILITLLRGGPIRIRVAEYNTILAYLPVYIADELGYFAREGLEVSFTQTFGDSATWRSVVERNAEFGVSDPIAMLDDGNDAGLLVAALVVRSPTRAVTRRVMSPVTAPKILKGLPLRVSGKDTTSHKLLSNFLRSGGIDPDAADIQIMKPHAEASHLLDPCNPVVFTIDPEAAAALQNGAREVFNGSIAHGEFLNTGVFVRRDYARQDPATVQRFVTAVEAALCFMQANRGFTVDFAVRKFRDTSRNSIMVGVARLFADGVYPKHVTLHTHLWSRAVANRFGEVELPRLQFADHSDRSFAERAVASIEGRRDWTGLRAKIRHALRRRR